MPAVPIAPAPPPRPAIPIAAALMLVGAVVVVIGCALTWLTLPEGFEQIGIPREWNGFTEVGDERNDGIPFTSMAVIIAGFGVASLAARRVLPVVVIGLVIAAFGVVAAIVDLADVADTGEFPTAFGPEVGPGLPVVIAGFAIAVAGFITGIAKRRRAPA